MSKKMHPLAWVGIGCGILLVVGFLAGVGGCFFVGKKVKDIAEDFEANPARAAAEVVVRVNPELEKVSVDDSAGTMTVRNTTSGEVYTLDFEDIAEGRFEVRDSEGNVTFGTEPESEGGGVTVRTDEGQVRFGGGGDVDELPDWVPVYPGSEVSSTYSASDRSSSGGMYQFTSADGVDEVADYLEKKLAAEGFEVKKTSVDAGGAKTVILNGEAEGGRTAAVSVSLVDGETQGSVQYSDKG